MPEAQQNFFEDPSAIRAASQKAEDESDIPIGLVSNPYFDDEPSTPESAEFQEQEEQKAQKPSPSPTKERRELDSEEPEAKADASDEAEDTWEPPGMPGAQQQAPPQAQIDPNQLAQAIAQAMQRSQPQPRMRPEDFDPPEIDGIDEEAILEGRSSLKKALREVQVSSSRHTREQILQALSPYLQNLQHLQEYVRSRAPVDEVNARSAARAKLLERGAADESQVDELLARAGKVIQDRWDYRTQPSGWEAAAQFVISQGGLPVKKKTKPPTGVGKGDVKPSRKKDVRSNKYIRLVESLNGKPMSEESLASFEEKFA